MKFKAIFSIVAVLMLQLVGCGSDTSTSSGTSSSGSGGAPTEVGESQAIVKFQASRDATQQDPSIKQALAAQTEAASKVSLDPKIEAAQATVEDVPVEWVAERVGMLKGALTCAKIGAIKAGATTIEEALGSIGTVGAILFAAENDELAALVAQK